MDKPIIRFYEPFEIVVIFIENNKEIMSYLFEKNISESQMLEKYDIDYDSFIKNNIRDEEGYPENLKTKRDVEIFLLDYINN